MILKQSIDCDDFHESEILIKELEEVTIQVENFSNNLEDKYKTNDLPEKRENILNDPKQLETKLLNIDQAATFEKSLLQPEDTKQTELEITDEIEEQIKQDIFNNFDQLFFDIWEDNFDQEKLSDFSAVIAEISEEIKNDKDKKKEEKIKDIFQGYIDDHRLKGKIFLKMMEIINFRTTQAIISEKPKKIIELMDGELIEKLDDTFYNLNCVSLEEIDPNDNNLSVDQEEKYSAALDMEGILRIIKKDRWKKEDLNDFLENYYFDLKNKINFLYQNIRKICKENTRYTVDINFEPQVKLSEKDLKYMLENFGFGKYMIEVVEYNNRQNDLQEIPTKNEEPTPVYKPIAYDSSKIKQFGQGKVFFQFENLFEKSMQKKFGKEN